MGDRCTRHCAFCAIGTGRPRPLDPEEPERVGRAVSTLGLKHAVITSVTRDDLEDQGAGHFASVVESIRTMSPSTRIELLIPDMASSRTCLSMVISSRPDVIGHNIETVARLQSSVRDPRSGYRRSLATLKEIKDIDRSMLTKSSVMLGLGEGCEEVVDALRDLRSAGVDAVTIGQYLKPRGGRLEVTKYVHPEVFVQLRDEAVAMGFRHVSSGPFVRSSFNAHELFEPSGENDADRRL
jgi:lipoic acid synthetase